MDKKVVILSFSGRINGNCAAVGDYIKQFYMRTNVLYFAMDNETFPACGGCDYECLKQGLRCPVLTETQREIMDTISDSDLVYFIVPNYCGYPCANYFAFNERSVGYFNMDRALMDKYMAVKKRFIVVSNSEENFAEAMRQQTKDQPDILYLKSRKYQKNSIAGDLLTSEAARSDLQAFLAIEASL